MVTHMFDTTDVVIEQMQYYTHPK